MKISVKLTILLLAVSAVGFLPMSFYFIKSSEDVITEKTFDVCYNLASNLSTIAREELLLNNTYEGSKGVLEKLQKTKDESLLSAYIFNKYGIKVADIDASHIGEKVSEVDLEYFNKVNAPNISTIGEKKAKKIRFEFPVYLEEENNSSLRLGFVVFEYDKFLLYETVNKFKKNLIYNSVIFSLFIIILSLIISKVFSKNIRLLSEGVNRIGSGDLTHKLSIHSRDEIGELANNFNIMAEKLKEADKFKAALLNSYSKFVPIEFLDYLKKDSILEIKLGDQIEINMTILFSDIRSFTTLSEKLSADDTFKFVNSYLKIMEPQVKKHNGFVDKYIGDAIMALFRDPSDAINAGIDMLDELYIYNQKRARENLEKISIGIGIHTGKLILGIVGSEYRVQGTVISDAVNLASRLEGLTKLYGASLLISDSTLQNLNNKDIYKYRMIDTVKVKGKEKPVDVIEILNGNSRRIIDLKLATSEILREGIIEFKLGNFKKAIGLFSKVLEMDPMDKAAKLHLHRSEYFDVHGVPMDWEGVTSVDEK
jgi:class 3 adenylate cyclase/HAMP domain-containing protein